MEYKSSVLAWAERRVKIRGFAGKEYNVDQGGRMVVIDRNGMRGFVEPGSSQESEGNRVLVRFGDDRLALVPARLLAPQEGGSRHLQGSFTDFERLSDVDSRQDEGQTTTIPIVEEKIDVEKRRVERGRIRVSKHVYDQEEIVDVPGMEEKLEVRRVTVNRVVDEPVPPRYEGDTLVLPLLEEVVVVEKRLMLKEELYISKTRSEKRRPQRVKLRREEVSVERIEAPEEEKV